MVKVKLEYAWCWTCPECGRLNIEHGLPIPKEHVESAHAQAVDEGWEVDADELVFQPARVLCLGCSRTFATEQEQPR